uniref:Uncharacterized protein n=1 Tax=viral metagenome TaxID=1070528 RepID=A0A6H1Z9R3_9ZZZZ
MIQKDIEELNAVVRRSGFKNWHITMFNDDMAYDMLSFLDIPDMKDSHFLQKKEFQLKQVVKAAAMDVLSCEQKHSDC